MRGVKKEECGVEKPNKPSIPCNSLRSSQAFGGDLNNGEGRIAGVSIEMTEQAHSLVVRFEDEGLTLTQHFRNLQNIKHARENDHARQQNNIFYTNDPVADETRALSALRNAYDFSFGMPQEH